MEVFILVAFYIITLLYSVILHEVSHGWMALLCGDQTAKLMGRLSLEPARHIDPFGSILLPALMIISTGFAFGWAKPVPVNVNNLRNQRWDPVRVALIGPITNYTLAIIFAGVGALLPLALEVKTAIATSLLRGQWVELASHVTGDTIAAFFALCSMMIFWNVLLGTFNLIPIPPLDGSRVLYALIDVPWNVKSFLERWGFLLVFGAILFTPLGALFSVGLYSLLDVFFGIALR